MPRRGSRVRIPSRALKEIEKRVIQWMTLFSMFEPCRVRTVRMSTLRSGRRSRTSPGRSATSRALKEIEKRVIRWMALFSMFKPCRARTVRMSPLRCPYSRCQFPGCGSCPSDRWQYGQRSSRQTHARYMESIQEFPYTVLQRRETSPLKNACRKQAGYFLCIASAPSLGQNKERIVAIKKLLCNHFT